MVLLFLLQVKVIVFFTRWKEYKKTATGNEGGLRCITIQWKKLLGCDIRNRDSTFSSYDK